MSIDVRSARDQGSMNLELEMQIEEILEEQIMGLESKIRLQLEEKALTWVEEECKKRLETLRESIREGIQQEVERWIEGELKRRMEEFRIRNEKI